MNDRYLAYCCPVCRRVKDQDRDGSADHDWCTMADYITRHVVQGQDILLSECYCSDCSMSYDRLVEYGRTSPSCFL